MMSDGLCNLCLAVKSSEIMHSSSQNPPWMMSDITTSSRLSGSVQIGPGCAGAFHLLPPRICVSTTQEHPEQQQISVVVIQLCPTPGPPRNHLLPAHPQVSSPRSRDHRTARM